MATVLVLGAGGWGLGLALASNRAGHTVTVWSCFEKEIAWLEPNTRIADENTNIHKIREMCADFGIKKCVDAEQYNGILKDLGEDAYDTAFIPTDNGGQVQSL